MEYTGFSGSNQLLELSPLNIWLPIPVPFPFPKNVAMTMGTCISYEEKMIGITPAVFTLSGMWVDCPP